MLALTDSALAPLCHLRHGRQPDRRRALELLVASRDGCTEAMLRAHGFSVRQIVDLVRLVGCAQPARGCRRRRAHDRVRTH
jgi:hypothetical protein